MKIYQLDKNAKDKRITAEDCAGLQEIERLKLKGSRYECIQTSIVIAPNAKLTDLTVQVAPMTDTDGVASSNTAVCYSTQGVDKFGVAFQNPIDVEEGQVKELFLAFDLRGLDVGRYKSALAFKDKFGTKEYDVIIDVNNDEVVDNLDTFDYKLEWLDSTVGIDESIPSPYTPIIIEGRVVQVLGKKVLIGTNGLVEQVVGYWDDSLVLADTPQSALFAAPIKLTLARQELQEKDFSIEGTEREAKITAVSENVKIRIETNATIDYTGIIKYNIKLVAKEDVPLPYVALKLFFDPYNVKYSMGLGMLGGKVRDFHFKFDNTKNIDTLFCGGHKLGCAVKFVASDECEPYGSRVFDIPKTSWDNYGRGHIEGKCLADTIEIVANSGLFVMTKGEEAEFAFDLMLTPFRPYDLVAGTDERYAYLDIQKSIELSIATARRFNTQNVILDSGNRIYQAANNPILSAKEIVEFLKETKYYKAKTALCYDLNYLSSTNSLFKPLSMLDDKLIVNTESSVGEVPGLDVRPVMVGSQEVAVGDNKTATDLIFAVDPKSRFCNFYIQSVAEIIKKIDIDGIFLSNTVMDGFTTRRLRKVLSADAKDYILGLYISDQREQAQGSASGFNKHMQQLPYLDKVILSADCADTLPPEYFLTELSGLLYGLTTTVDRLPNPYLGMLYGMSAQAGLGDSDPTIIYDIWHKFGLKDARIMGYWMDNPPIIADKASVKITTFAKADSCLAVFYNFSDQIENVVFGINTDILGFSTLDKQIRIVTTSGKKVYKKVKNPDEGIKIGPKNGLIIKIF